MFGLFYFDIIHFGTLLTANGSLRNLNLTAFGGMILNISLNLYLIPQFKASGAALAGFDYSNYYGSGTNNSGCKNPPLET